MTRLIDDLLDVSRIAHHKITLRKDEVDLTQLVKTAIEDHRLRLGTNSVQLEFHAPNKSIWVYGDEARLSQVMGNLLSNANKFTDRNGQVTVSLEATGDGEALVSVSDTGIGMDAWTINHVFEPFTQADRSIDRSHGGLGLGLALAKGLIEQHDGKLSAESAGPGCGSRFMFTLPQSMPTHHPAIPAGPTRPAQPQRVLLIEDNLDTAEALKMLLELSGHIVTVAHSGNEGIEQARRHRPQVVVCDIGLPGANGYDVARALRSDPENQSTYMIAMTGYGRDEDKRMAIAAGFDQHLTKPIGIDAPFNDKADNLKLIKGIGAKNEKICNDLGVFHFTQIADWSSDEAAWVGHHMAFPGRVEREHWIPQAKLLASGGDTDHSTGVKAGTIALDEGADAPLDEAQAAMLRGALPEQAAPVENETRHAGRRPYGLRAPRGGQRDNLKRIRGIGPQNESRLHGIGIWHYGQIAAWSAENIKWISSYLAASGRIEREKWVDQARELAASGDTESSRRTTTGKSVAAKTDHAHGRGNPQIVEPHKEG